MKKLYMNPDAGGWLDFETILEQWPHKDEGGRYYTKPTTQEMGLYIKTLDPKDVANMQEFFVLQFLNAVDEKYGYSTVKLSEIYDFSIDYLDKKKVCQGVAFTRKPEDNSRKLNEKRNTEMNIMNLQNIIFLNNVRATAGSLYESDLIDAVLEYGFTGVFSGLDSFFEEPLEMIEYILELKQEFL